MLVERENALLRVEFVARKAIHAMAVQRERKTRKELDLATMPMHLQDLYWTTVKKKKNTRSTEKHMAYQVKLCPTHLNS